MFLWKYQLLLNSKQVSTLTFFYSSCIVEGQIIMFGFIKKYKISIAFILVGLLIVGWTYFGGTNKPNQEVVVAAYTDLIQEVSVTGRVKPVEEVNLSFEKSGKVSAVFVKEGTHVGKGRVLVRQSSAELFAELNKARATLKGEEARLDELKRGTREEELQVHMVNVENAKIARDDARENLFDKLTDAYTKSDDAVRNKADQLFSNPKSINPQLRFTITGQLASDIAWGRLRVESILNEWQGSLQSLSLENSKASHTSTAKSNFTQIQSFLTDLAFAVNGFTADANFSQTTIDGWKTDVATARSNINTAENNLTVAYEKLRTAESALTLEEKQLALKQAGTVAEHIAVQEAQVERAVADVASVEAELSKTVLISPLDGIVTRVDAKVGEIVSAGTPIVSLISSARFEIEAHVPEVDVAKIKVEDSATVTLDAYGSDVSFEAMIVSINPAAEIIDGVATYKTVFQFVKEDDRVKSGMTADIDVRTAKRDHVIVVPQRSVIEKDGEKFVRILNGDTIEEVKVETGLRGSDGNIEITTGINEGDTVVTFSTKE